MKKRIWICVLTILAICIGIISPIQKANAAQPKMNKRSAILGVGKSVSLSVSGTTVIKWSSVDKKIAKVSKKGKVTAVSVGETTIKAKCKNGKTYKCNVKVTSKKNESQSYGVEYLKGVKIRDYGEICLDLDIIDKFEYPLTLAVEFHALDENDFSYLDLTSRPYYYEDDIKELFQVYPDFKGNVAYFYISKEKRKQFENYHSVYFAGHNLEIDKVTINGVKKESSQEADIEKDTPYSTYGKLHVENGQLIGENDKTFRVIGMLNGFHLMYPEYTHLSTYQYLRDSYGINTLRISSDGGEAFNEWDGGNGYKDAILYWASKKVDLITKAGMYAILDWETNTDDILDGVASASEYFEYMSKKYADYDNVIYEIDNEPHSDETTWEKVKEYANRIIPIIRANDPDAVIIVGTPEYSLKLESALENPLEYENILYTYHQYVEYKLYDDGWDSKVWNQELMAKLEAALEQGLPVIMTEIGQGTDVVDLNPENFDKRGALTESNKEGLNDLMKILDKYNVGYVGWVNPDGVIRPDCHKITNWKMSDMTEYGKWFLNKTKKDAAKLK